MFPIMDATSRVIGFGGRLLQGEGAKYINSPATVVFDKSQCLYGLNHTRQAIVNSDQAVVVEGYTDCIMARQLGCHNVVATMGTSLTGGHGRILRRYCKTVVLVFDGDVAGKEAAARGMEVCLQQHIDIKIVVIPGGRDPCDYLLTEGPERFHEILDQAVDVLAFCWERLLDQFQGHTTLAGKKAAMEQFLETIALAVATGRVSVLERGLIVNRLTGIIGLEARQITSELNRRVDMVLRRTRRRTTTDFGKGTFVHPSGLRPAAEREILEVLLNRPDLYKQDDNVIRLDDFEVPLYRKIAELIFNTIQNSNTCELSQLLARIESVDMAAVVTECAGIGEQKGHFEARLRDAVHILRHGGAGVREDGMDQSTVLNIGKDEYSASRQNRYSFGLTD
jgi:DNA primase